MGTHERLGVNIHVDQLMDGIANNCLNLERLELRWDPENLRFSDKSQKAIDIIRVKCLKLRSLVLRYNFCQFQGVLFDFVQIIIIDVLGFFFLVMDGIMK